MSEFEITPEQLISLRNIGIKWQTVSVDKDEIEQFKEACIALKTRYLIVDTSDIIFYKVTVELDIPNNLFHVGKMFGQFIAYKKSFS